MEEPLNGLKSARLKVIRASEHYNAIQEHITAYRSGNPYDIIMQPDGTEKVAIFKEPPPIISILAGEILYQIRSALDHLVFELIKSNPSGMVLPNEWEDRCQFPIFFELPKGIISPPVPQRCFVSKLPGITEAAYTFIELLQPYYGMNKFGFLQILAELSNIDKHRHLNITVASVGRHEIVTRENGQPISVSVQAGLYDGAEFRFPTTPDAVNGIVNVQRSTFVNVAFSEPSTRIPSAVEPVQAVLHLLIRDLRDGIIPTFESLLKGP